MVVATHDVEFVAAVADRVVVMAEGEVVADGPTPEVMAASPAFAPQVAKILAPLEYLTTDRSSRRPGRGGAGDDRGPVAIRVGRRPGWVIGHGVVRRALSPFSGRSSWLPAAFGDVEWPR